MEKLRVKQSTFQTTMSFNEWAQHIYDETQRSKKKLAEQGNLHKEKKK